MIITTAIIKGGAGKTTTAAALAQYARCRKKKVLAVDLDGQGNLTSILGGDSSASHNSYDLLTGITAQLCIQPTALGIDLVPASADLSLLTSGRGTALRLKQVLSAFDIRRRYDYIIIDTPPSIGECALNALVAADALIIPLEADASSIAGLIKAVKLARELRTGSDSLRIMGAFITRYDGRSKANQALREMIMQQCESLDIPFLGEVRQGIAIKEAQLLHQNFFRYALTSNPAQDYVKIFKKEGI